MDQKKTLLLEAFLGLTLSLSFVPLILGIQAYRSIASQGTIGAPNQSPKLLFTGNFEDLQVSGHEIKWSNGSSLSLLNTMVFYHAYSNASIVDSNATDYPKCLKFNSTGSGGYERCEFLVYPQYVGAVNEFFFDSYLYLPPGYTNTWHEIGPWSEHQPSGAYLMAHFQIMDQGIASQRAYFYIDETVSGQPKTYIYGGPNGPYFNGVIFPTDQWFHYRCYTRRDPTNGIVKIWIDNTLILDVEGIKTKDAGSDYFCELTGIYGTSISPQEIYCKAFWIYSGMP